MYKYYLYAVIKDRIIFKKIDLRQLFYGENTVHYSQSYHEHGSNHSDAMPDAKKIVAFALQLIIMAKQVAKKVDAVTNLPFGEHLEKIRKSKKLSLRDVADMCSLDNSNISKIEKGKINITLGTIIELAKGLGVHPKELLDYDFK